MIDEYDNFVNEVMVRDPETYHAFFGRDGPYKQLFKSVKAATEGQGLERVFVTGVSPVALSDLTSGFNTATDVSLKGSLAGLCGFYEAEIQELLAPVAEERGLSDREGERLLDTMRSWYNGYRFSERAGDHVYNPTNVLFFLREVYLEGEVPRTSTTRTCEPTRPSSAFWPGRRPARASSRISPRGPARSGSRTCWTRSP